jgi:quercetin dioxygenase-like cupin family protein
MRQSVRAFLFAATFIAAAGLAQAATILLPGDLKWTPGSGTSAGQMIAVVYGDPSKPGPFTIRVKSPDGFSIAAHYHAAVENVTVLQGTLLLGFGDKADEAKTTAIPTGGFYSIPKGVHHYAFAEGETILQIDSTGPRTKQRIEP